MIGRSIRGWDTQVKAFEEAAATVLSQSRRPLTIRELMDRMISDGLVKPTGRTPHQSLYAIILRSNRRRKSEGKPRRFVSRRKGRFVVYTLARR